VAHVTGVDLTPAMLDLARQAVVEESLANTDFLDGDMCRLAAPDQAFDGAVSRYAFHHLAAPAAAMRELVRVTRPGGAIVLLDAAPPADRRDAYDAFERARDPSHTTALTVEELLALGEAHHLGPAFVERFRLPMTASALLAHAYPESATREDLRRRLVDDAGRDRLGFNAGLDGDDIAISFPLAAIAWRLPH
jgi:ubiquinone/menaquinone biosynthesis C-methylase UbiE